MATKYNLHAYLDKNGQWQHIYIQQMTKSKCGCNGKWRVRRVRLHNAFCPVSMGLFDSYEDAVEWLNAFLGRKKLTIAAVDSAWHTVG